MRNSLAILSLFIVCSSAAVVLGQEVVLPPETLQHQSAVPDIVLYHILLHQVATFKHKADELDRQGMDGSPYRKHIAKKFGLTSQQTLYLDEVALQYREDVKQYQADLEASIKRFHEQNFPMADGQRPALPPEAQYLLRQRDDVTRRARDQFHVLIGDEEFRRIDVLVKSRVAAGIRSIPSTAIPPTGAAHAK